MTSVGLWTVRCQWANFTAACGTDVRRSHDFGHYHSVILHIELNILRACNMLSNHHHGLFQNQPTKWMLGLCRYELSVDDKKQSKKNPAKDRAGKSPDSIKKFYFGGSPLKTQQANFTGCISNAYFTRCVASS